MQLFGHSFWVIIALMEGRDLLGAVLFGLGGVVSCSVIQEVVDDIAVFVVIIIGLTAIKLCSRIIGSHLESWWWGFWLSICFWLLLVSVSLMLLDFVRWCLLSWIKLTNWSSLWSLGLIQEHTISFLVF